MDLALNSEQEKLQRDIYTYLEALVAHELRAELRRLDRENDK